MKLRSLAPWLVLAALAALTAAGLHLTRDETAAPALDRAGGPVSAPGAQPASAAANPAAARRGSDRLVDMQPLLTARRMAALARTPEEQELARQASRLADHAVDLALADSIRRIAEESPELSPEQKALQAAKQKAQAALEAAQKREDALAERIFAAKGDEQDRLADQHDLAEADKELARDELEEASERLARAGGDPQARIKRLRAAFAAAQKDAQGEARPAAPAPGTATAAAPGPAGDGSLLDRVRSWSALRRKRAQVEAARDEAVERGKRLAGWSDRIRERMKTAAAGTEQARQAGAGAGALDTTAKQAALQLLEQAARDQRRLATLGARRQDQQELADVYGDWTALADGQIRAAGHLALRTLAWLLGAAALVFLLAALIDRLLRRGGEKHTRLGTMRSVVRLGVEVAGLGAVALVAAGMPVEATTMLGLATAGLTVALKDFIVAFVGWFVLMGKNGLRVGDWVEIEGVAGEVAEISILHTVLLETGGRGEAGHPTGRRVSFVNTFAIEGHFFNFSTSGQWTWDELKVVVPAAQDPYPIIDAIQKLVERETKANAAEAEQEWKKSGGRYRARAFAAVPAVTVLPAAGGVELEVRYVTRAYERQEARQRLNQAVVELLHGPRPEAAPPPA